MTIGAPASLAALSARIPGREFAMLTDNADPADAYAAAVAYCEGAAKKAGATLDWDAAVEALRFRFWFELYAAVEGEAVASDKERKADQLLAQLLGDAAVAPVAAAAQAPVANEAVGVVMPGARPAGLEGFKTR